MNNEEFLLKLFYDSVDSNPDTEGIHKRAVQQMFLLYLLRKYQSHCLVFSETKTNKLDGNHGLRLGFRQLFDDDDDDYEVGEEEDDMNDMNKGREIEEEEDEFEDPFADENDQPKYAARQPWDEDDSDSEWEWDGTVRKGGGKEMREYILRANTNENRKPDILNELKESLAACVSRKVPLVIVPLFLSTTGKKVGHANMLIFRPATSTFEHFEPHGFGFGLRENDAQVVQQELESVLQIIYPHPFTLVKASEVCPVEISLRGLQSLETHAAEKKGPLEPGGYCVVWSLFFAEMVLRNPTKSSAEVYELLMQTIKSKFQTLDERKTAMRRIIRSYALRMGRLIFRYFETILKTLYPEAQEEDLLKRVREYTANSVQQETLRRIVVLLLQLETARFGNPKGEALLTKTESSALFENILQNLQDLESTGNKLKNVPVAPPKPAFQHKFKWNRYHNKQQDVLGRHSQVTANLAQAEAAIPRLQNKLQRNADPRWNNMYQVQLEMQQARKKELEADMEYIRRRLFKLQHKLQKHDRADVSSFLENETKHNMAMVDHQRKMEEHQQLQAKYDQMKAQLANLMNSMHDASKVPEAEFGGSPGNNMKRQQRRRRRATRRGIRCSSRSRASTRRA